MQKARDDIIRLDSDCTGLTWDSLGIEHVHDVCRAAILKCTEINENLSKRFKNLQGLTPLLKREERNWLILLLETWFMKKWNTKQGTDQRKDLNSNSKKRKAIACDCGRELVSVRLVCDGVRIKVRKS